MQLTHRSGKRSVMTLKRVVLFPYLGRNKPKDFHFKARIDDPALKVSPAVNQSINSTRFTLISLISCRHKVNPQNVLHQAQLSLTLTFKITDEQDAVLNL